MALDVYGLTWHRDVATINRFLDEYVDRAANADRGDEELALEPLDEPAGGADWNRAWEPDWEPALSLSHIVERGLAYPRRAFTNYFSCLPQYRQAGIERVILAFTRDDQLVLGLSVSLGYNMLEAEAVAGEARAHELLAHLATTYNCHLGLILLETPPPHSEAEFRHPPKTLPVHYSASFDT